MPIGNWNLEWLNHNSQRAYPLSLDATRTDTTGAFVLPNSLIVDLQLPISLALNVNSAKFYIKSVSNFEVGVSVVVGYDSDSGAVDVASALIPRTGHTAYKAYALGGIGDFADSNGFIVIGPLDELDEQLGGTWEFDLDGGRLELDVIRPQLRGVASITVVNGTSVSARIYNDVELAAGTNARLPVTIAEGEDPVIRIDFIEGAGSVEPCLCEDTDLSPPIRRINGIAPTAAGDFTVAAGNCLTITSVANGIKLIDNCSAPCCDCTELTPIIEDQKLVGEKLRTLEALIAKIDGVVTQTDSVILGSLARVGEGGCSS